jgi:hypothetical protein
MATARAVVAVALAVALGSALPLQGGAESARAEVGSATGPLVATGGGAVLMAEGLRPGDVRIGEVTVLNAGDSGGAFTLAQADRVDSPTPAGPLSSVLDLTVTDLTASRLVYAGKLAAMASVALGDLAQGAAHRYRFAVGFPMGAPGLDDQLQAATTTVSYVWSAGPLAPAPPVAPAQQPPATATPQATAPATLGKVSRPTARLAAAARQRGRTVRVTLTCTAACRARFTATARAGRRTARVRTVTRTLRRPGRVTVRLRLPRRTHRTTVRVSVRVTIDRRTIVLRKTVRLVH